MIFSTIIGDYVRWHYTRAFGELFHLWLNFLWFIIHFFSLKELMTSLLSPWRRMTEQKRQGWNFEDMMSYIIINLLSRIIGFIMRSGVIIIGLVCLTITIITGAILFLLWLFLPALVVATLLAGVALLTSNLLV
ncbi:MAG: hypothetical protein KBC62_02860 [Candidatus Pacebacteria bacterium]|nr:hypothetical protein [Candidatus Paceibacterota bacterium]